ncbi:hypothetical protein BDV36DRAFT_277734, partial [Aspergillus pseudocaelatus]
MERLNINLTGRLRYYQLHKVLKAVSSQTVSIDVCDTVKYVQQHPLVLCALSNVLFNDNNG